jgi:hypothetical protein
MNDREVENNDLKRDEVVRDEASAERLTTKDMAAGAAVKRAPEKSDQRTDSRGFRSAARGDDERSREQAQMATPLFDEGESEKFRAHWLSIQTQFVDEPRNAVKQADELVAATMKRLAEVFASERDNLERDWDSGQDISTEDLRIALQRYRAFFDRLLSV